MKTLILTLLAIALTLTAQDKPAPPVAPKDPKDAKIEQQAAEIAAHKAVEQRLAEQVQALYNLLNATVNGNAANAKLAEIQTKGQ